MKIKAVFMGTPEIARDALEALNEICDVALVVTQPDKFVGRKKVLTKSPVKLLAESLEVPVFQPYKIKEEYDAIIKLNPDIIVTCAYGQILPKELLDLPKYGALNIHASLLPKYRGGAPIERSIMNGDKKTGITLMHMDIGMDTGDIIYKEEIAIDDLDTKETLTKKLSILAQKIIKKNLPLYLDGAYESAKQDDSLASYAPIISKEDEYLSFNKSSLEVYNHIRALSPEPSVYALLDNKRYKFYEAKLSNFKGTPGEILAIDEALTIGTLDGAIDIISLQEAGKKKMSAKDYFSGKNKKEYIGKRFNEENN